MADDSLVNIEIEGYGNTVVYSNLRVEQSIGDHHFFKFQWSVTNFVANSSQQLYVVDCFLGREIKISFKDNDFIGIITNITIEEQHGSTQTFIVSGNSPTILLEDTIRSSSYYKKELKDIINAVLNGVPSNELATKIDPADTEELFYIVQYNETDFEFIQRLAKRYGEWFYYDGKTMVFGAKGDDCDELKSGLDLDNFRLSTKIKGLNLSFTGWDPHKAEQLESQVTGGGSGNDYLELATGYSQKVFSRQSDKVFHASIAHNKMLLNTIISVQKDGAASDLVEYTGFSKNTSLKVGSDVKISNLDASVSNKYLLCKVTHFSNVSGHYSNSFVAIPSSVIVPPYTNPFIVVESGIQVATVKDNADPDNLGRLKVVFPWQRDGTMSPWIRVLQPHGGGGAGSSFTPEIGDELLVCFEENNIENPFALGVLYNGNAQPKKIKFQKNG